MGTMRTSSVTDLFNTQAATYLTGYAIPPSPNLKPAIVPISHNPS